MVRFWPEALWRAFAARRAVKDRYDIALKRERRGQKRVQFFMEKMGKLAGEILGEFMGEREK